MMSDELNGPRVKGSRYVEWWHALESLNPEAVAPGNSSNSKRLIWVLFEVGRRNGATTSEFNYEGSAIAIDLVSRDEFDWNQDIVFVRTPQYELPPERLIEEIETATGITADAPLEDDIEPMVARLREAREARDGPSISSEADPGG